jgi:hypothetical protein
MKTLLKQWGGSTCTQDAPKNVHKKYSHDRATNCPISFAQICGLVLYVGEQKEPTPLLCVVNKASIWRSLKILEFLWQSDPLQDIKHWALGFTHN